MVSMMNGWCPQRSMKLTMLVKPWGNEGANPVQMSESTCCPKRSKPFVLSPGRDGPLLELPIVGVSVRGRAAPLVLRLNSRPVFPSLHPLQLDASCIKSRVFISIPSMMILLLPSLWAPLWPRAR